MSEKIIDRYLPPRELWPDRIYKLPGMNYPRKMNATEFLLDENLDNGNADKIAIYFKDSRITYLELSEKVNRLANGLKALGIEPQDRVMLRLRNEPDFIVSWLAVLRIGAINVATMPLFRIRELQYVADDSMAKAMIVSADLLEEVEKGRGRLGSVENIIVAGGNAGGYLSLEEIVAKSSPHAKPFETDKEDAAILGYTSGSTGAPKGAVHFHSDILSICDSFGKNVIEPEQGDLFGGSPSMAFALGLGGLLIIPLRFGASTVLLDIFTPEAMLKAIEKHKVTVLYGTPTSYNMMLQAGESLARRCDLSSLRICKCAGEPLSPALFNRWNQSYGKEIYDGMGTTEMLHDFISNKKGQLKVGATGLIVSGYEGKLVDENFKEVPHGKPGLLAVKGPTGCRYWRNVERQKEYVRDGWNVPADIFIRDQDGYLWYQCRNDDMIISSGYNIAGPEVEKVLLEHPQVVEAAVVASPDPVRGQVPKAFIVLKNGVEGDDQLKAELKEFVKSELAPYKYPRDIEFVKYLPLTGTGKIKRFELRELEKQRYLERQSHKSKA